MNGSTSTIFRIVGLVACLVVTAPNFVLAWFAGPQEAVRSLTTFLGLEAGQVDAVFRVGFLVQLSGVTAFAVAFCASTRPTARPDRTGIALLVAQFVLALLSSPDLLIIVAAELPFVLPLRLALAWLTVQSAAIALLTVYAANTVQFNLTASIGTQAVHLATPSLPPLGAIFVMEVLTDVAWQAFAFCMGHIAAAERGGRTRLARVHAELVAMQQLLTNSARSCERLRIARDLHDALGHHLTALSLHLDLAARQAVGKVAEPILTSRRIARQLLVEVRTAVAAERSEQPIGLRQALQTLCSGIPYPVIDLSCDERLEVNEPALADVIFRGVQEGISNALRHSGADTIKVTMSVQGSDLAVIVSDNGKGACGMRPGNGLRGMRERVEAQGGTMEAGPRPVGGFAVTIRLPYRAGSDPQMEGH